MYAIFFKSRRIKGYKLTNDAKTVSKLSKQTNKTHENLQSAQH